MPQFSFTLTIPSFKKVYYDGCSIAYGLLPQKKQHLFLENLLLKVMRPLKYDFIDYVFEEHEDGRLHIHGYCTNCQHEDVVLLVHDFYTYNRIIGMSIKSYKKVSNIQQSSYDNISPWLYYIEKHQDKILYRSRYRQEKIDSCQLDGRPIVFIEKNDRACNTSEFEDYNTFNNSYDFKGKDTKNNKFTIEI